MLHRRRNLVIFAVAFSLLLGTKAKTSEIKEHADYAKNVRIERIEKPLVKIEKRGDRNYVVGTVLIDAKTESIWSVLVDYSHAPKIFKNLKSCEVVGQKGEAKLVRQIVNTGSPITFDYTVLLVEKKPYSIEWARESGSFKEVTGTWQLEPVEFGRQTRVTYSIFIDGGMFLPGWLLTPQLKGYLPVVLNALRDKMQGENIASNKREDNEIKKDKVVGRVSL
jgi:ribosome-associated toxin RatA of RatAB toxin-antitoxin module